jgi:hypothetical protein
MSKIIIKAFRSVDHPDLCELFAAGHERVLEEYGVKRVTSADRSWFTNPDVYGLLAFEHEGNRVLGGAKIHVYNKAQPLPVERAVAKKDPQLKQFLNNLSKDGRIGELCGLWNSRTVSGSGVSILLIKAGIAKAGIALANQIKLKALLGFCSPYTLDTILSLGFEVAEAVGQNGKFVYPSEEYIATLTILHDTDQLNLAEPLERDKILNLRINPVQNRLESGPKGELDIYYDLLIPSLENETDIAI